MAKSKKKKKKVQRPPKEWVLPEPRTPEEIVKPSRMSGLEYLTKEYFKKAITSFNQETYKKKGRDATPKECEAELTRIATIGETLYLEYDKTLIKLYNDKYFNSEQIDKLDRIDLSEISGDDFAITVTDEGFDDYCDNTENMYMLLPCYQKGIFLKEKSHCIYFDVLNIDTENKNFKIYLREYIRLEDSGDDDWSIGCGGEIFFDFNNPEEHINNIKPTEATKLMVPDGIFTASTLLSVDDFDSIYTKISPRQLGWDKERCSMWQHIILQNAIDQIMMTRHIGQESHIEHLVNLFITSSIFTNYLLSSNRPTIVRKPKERNISSRMVETKPVDPDAPRVRTLGLIKFVSPKPPARVCEKVARTYIMTEWNVKSHIRHYKSGKIAYIKPTVRKRHKGLMNTEKAQPKQRITKLKNNKHLLNNV